MRSSKRKCFCKMRARKTVVDGLLIVVAAIAAAGSNTRADDARFVSDKIKRTLLSDSMHFCTRRENSARLDFVKVM